MSNEVGTYVRDTEVMYVNDLGDYETTSAGLRLDNSPRTKALLALKAKRGHYWFDLNYGSRFHELKTLRDAERNAQVMATEALQFMIDRGEILDVEVTSTEQDVDFGILKIHVALTVTQDDIVDIIVQRELPE
jgi:phage gp46-like protein